MAMTLTIDQMQTKLKSNAKKEREKLFRMVKRGSAHGLFDGRPYFIRTSSTDICQMKIPPENCPSG